MRRILKASALLSTALFAAAAVASSPATGATSTQFQPDRTMVKPARILYAPHPDFTQQLSDEFQLKGKVVLKLIVNDEGKAQDIKILNSTFPALNGPVLDAVSRYQFRPATVDHSPVPDTMYLTIKVRG